MLRVYYIWSNYSDLTRPHPKWWFSKGNHPISGKSRLVKYYNLARLYGGLYCPVAFGIILSHEIRIHGTGNIYLRWLAGFLNHQQYVAILDFQNFRAKVVCLTHLEVLSSHLDRPGICQQCSLQRPALL